MQRPWGLTEIFIRVAALRGKLSTTRDVTLRGNWSDLAQFEGD